MPKAHNPFNQGSLARLIPLAALKEKTADEIAIELQNSDDTNFSEKLVKLHGIRALRIWEVLAISLGQSQYRNRLETRRTQDRAFSRAYRDRLRLLTSKLSESPHDGLVLHLVNHPKNEDATELDQHLVDAVSAFGVLRRNFSYFPKELTGFEASIQDEPVPQIWYTDGSDALNSPEKESKTIKRDQTKTIAALMNRNMQTLFVQLVKDRYGTLNTETMGDIASQMEKDLKATGLKVGAITKQLQLGIGEPE